MRVKTAYGQLRRCVTPKRRARSCPRAVRQPVKGWPRLLHHQSVEGPLYFTPDDTEYSKGIVT